MLQLYRVAVRRRAIVTSRLLFLRSYALSDTAHLFYIPCLLS